jgi:hypothetical protein
MKLRIQEEQLEHLRKLLGAEESAEYQWLGYALNFKASSIRDLLDSKNVHHEETFIQIITVLLSHYALAKPTPRTGKLIKFKDLPGGYAYERAFVQRAVQPITQAFGEKPAELIEAAKVLKGKALSLGDASVEIPTLEGIPITYIVWAKGEFPATANVLFDETASNYLPTEDLAVLAELATFRLEKAKTTMKTSAVPKANKNGEKPSKA